MSRRFILLLSLLSLYSCQSLGLFAEKFLQESYKIKPIFAAKNKILTKVISKYVKSYKVESKHTLKTVDLTNIEENCDLEFEIELVQSQKLPASNHLIEHKSTGKKQWSCLVGVVINGVIGEPNKVHSLVYYLSVDFSKSELVRDSGLDLDEIDEKELASYLFYMECLRIYDEELSPIKS